MDYLLGEESNILLIDFEGVDIIIKDGMLKFIEFDYKYLSYLFIN